MSSTNHTILFPLLTLVGWTFCVLLLIPVSRFFAFFSGQVKADNFRLAETPDTPEYIIRINRNFMNLLEMPVLFYVLCILVYVTPSVITALPVLAWSYVVLRIAHSLIHLIWNHIISRFAVFAASNVILLIAWGIFAQHVDALSNTH